MSNTNINLQTQTSHALYNAIIEAGGKDRPPMLAHGNYNPPYKFKWTEKIVPVAEGSSKTTTEGYMENYKNVSQDVRNQLDAEAEAVQIILTRIDNDIYSTFDACLNFLLQIQPEWQRFMTLVKESQELKTVSYHKLYDILKQHQHEFNELRAETLASATKNKGKAIVNSPPPIYDQEPDMVTEDDALSKEKEIDKLMVLISLSLKKIYKPTNNNLRTSSNTSRANQDNTPRIKEDLAYHKEKMRLCKQEEAGIQLSAEQADWRDDTDDEPDDQELEARYLYMEKIQEVTPDVADNSGPIFDTEPEYPEQPESVNDTYLEEQGDTNITMVSLDMSTNGETVDQDDDALAKERDLLASLIEKLKCEIDDSRNRNIFLKTSNKTLIDKLKGEIEDFKTKNKGLESSNNHFKEANKELSKTNQLMFKDLKKFQAELDRYHDVNYALKVEIDCAKAKGYLMSYKMESQKSLNEHT
ncbi:hypothetical protein Tco_0955853 [Tanacetum coccineum]|uniref:Gag-Pol polyprotein n=1 Tax=Tanacetum coccineum TaxID=301880 RepID=A0ABQ5E8I2_9ASTR